MKLIKTGLFAGTRKDAEDRDNLSKWCISRVVTVDMQPLDTRYTRDNTLNTLHIHCLDEPTADLLTSFDKCIRFIDEGLENNQAVLVHCLSGVSRSITIILAYLMKTDNITLDDAFGRLNQLYAPEKLHPNNGFINQLKLYEEMNKTVDTSSTVFKQFRLELLASQIKDDNNSDESILSRFLEEVKSRNNTCDELFRCRKCRHKVFDSSSIVEHDQQYGTLSFGWNKERRSGHYDSSDKVECTSLFIEPVQWMSTALLGTLDGKLLCPKCTCRLGSFNWSGMQCSCASWVTPAFQFHKNKLDQVNNNQNI